MWPEFFRMFCVKLKIIRRSSAVFSENPICGAEMIILGQKTEIYAL
jgi:hypothetical protein